MDLTSLAMFFALIASAVGVDTVLHPTSVVLEANVAGKLDKLTVDSATLTDMLTFEVMQITSTPSILAPPEIRAGGNKGVGMAIAETVHMQGVALALQSQLGYQPEEIKLTLLGEDSATKALVSGSGMGGRIRTPPFQEQLVMQPNETLAALVHRAAVTGMTRIDPYVTALYLLESHVEDGDFTSAGMLIEAIKAQLPPTTISLDRSAFENLQGMMELFRGKLPEANVWFHRAIASDPTDVAAELNGGFVDVQLGRYQPAAQHIEALLAARPDSHNRVLLGTAYMIWAAALLGGEDFAGADAKAAMAVAADPDSAAARMLWSRIKREKGDLAAADRLHREAWDAAGMSKYYTEVAALYFSLALKPGQPLERSPFSNPSAIKFN